MRKKNRNPRSPRSGDMVRVKWQDAEHSENVELDRDWHKYKLIVHKTVGVILHNGKEKLVLITSEETQAAIGDIYVIPKDKWILGIELLKTKKELGK